MKKEKRRIVAFEKRVHELSNALDGTFGFFLRDLKEGWEFGIRQDELFPTASVFKIFVMIAAFQKAHDGALDLNKLIPVPERAADGGGLFAALSIRPVLPVLDHIKLMIMYSDNCATDVLLDLIGKKYINDTMKNLGFPHSHVGFSTTEMHYLLAGMEGLEPTPGNDRKVSRWLLDNPLPDNHITITNNPKNNVSTPRETAEILTQLFNGSLISVSASTMMLDILRLAASRETFGRYFPPEVPIAHKEGAFRRMHIDTGIVFFPGRPYVFSGFCRDLPFRQNYLGMDVLAGTGRALYNLANMNA